MQHAHPRPREGNDERRLKGRNPEPSGSRPDRVDLVTAPVQRPSGKLNCNAFLTVTNGADTPAPECAARRRPFLYRPERPNWPPQAPCGRIPCRHRHTASSTRLRKASRSGAASARHPDLPQATTPPSLHALSPHPLGKALCRLNVRETRRTWLLVRPPFGESEPCLWLPS